MKLIVKTTGDFQLLLDHGERAAANRPSIVTDTDYVQRFIASEQLEKVGTISAKANDADFEGYWKEANGDEEFALQSYRSSLSPKKEEPEPEAPKAPEPEPEPEPAKAAPAKAVETPKKK